MSPLVLILAGLGLLMMIAINDWRSKRPRCYFCGGRRHWLGVCTGQQP